MIKIKDDQTSLVALCPQLALAMLTVQDIYLDHGIRDVVITSGNDRKHSKGSKHYDGNALDLRVWGFIHPEIVAEQIQAALGSEFDCIFEGDHIHLEWHPKRKDL